jgi:hypothetical protein
MSASDAAGNEDQAFADALREQTLRAFNLKPWHIGLAPVPWRVRVWRWVDHTARDILDGMARGFDRLWYG